MRPETRIPAFFLADGGPSLTIVWSRESSLRLRKTIAQSFSLRRATIPQEWNHRPALSGKTRHGPKRHEEGLLCRPTAQYPTKNQLFLPRLHDLPLHRLARPASSQVRATLRYWAVETKRPSHSHVACGRSRWNAAARLPTSRQAPGCRTDKWTTNRRRTPGISSG
jgi:hypothetical protein